MSGGKLTATNDLNTMAVGLEGQGQLTSSNGTVRARTLILGTDVGGLGALTVAGGTALVNNVTGNAPIDVRRGTFNLRGGLVTTDSLVLTNATGLMTHSAGMINTKATAVTNRVRFVLGDWLRGATFHL